MDRAERFAWTNKLQREPTNANEMFRMSGVRVGEADTDLSGGKKVSFVAKPGEPNKMWPSVRSFYLKLYFGHK